jgi:type VI secretion system protein VasG
MSEISRIALFGKLNPLLYRSIESATLFCKMRGNPYVELAHWIHQIAELPDSDFHRILRHFSVDPSRLARDLTDSLDGLPKGATSVSDLSVHVEDSVERAWVYASLLFNESRVRSGHLVVGMLKTHNLKNALSSISREFAKLKIDALTDEFSAITRSSPEEATATSASSEAGSTPADERSPAPAAMGKQEALQRYAVDLTERARKGELDPVVGRDDEIRQIVHVLLRRRQNNPILTGEAGVGKTAVVEGFAQRVAQGDVPPALQHVSVRALDIGLLQAGASMKGEFEARLRQVIDEVQSSAKPVILFIDEAHTLVGAGGAAGTGDAANLLKPALARGKLRTIAATTWAEYKKHIEPDPALTRRFQVVQVAEPAPPKALIMMRGVARQLRSHHGIELLDEAVEAAVRLGARYIPDRQLPDKAVSLLDTACARAALTQHSVPTEIEQIRRRIEALGAELDVVKREEALGIQVGSRREDIEASVSAETSALKERETRWDAEKKLVTRIVQLQTELSGDDGPTDETAQAGEAASRESTSDEQGAALGELQKLRAELAELQGETPLVIPTVDAQAVAAVVSDWTGVPTGRMVKNEIESVLGLAELLGERIIGQGHALASIARRIQTARAHLENPNKPIGVFLLAGPSGVGKTETALGLAETLYGGEKNLIVINMSEFQEAHTVSTLKGAPPGYVGYGEGGVLTEAVRRRPYSVVLLDEVEKAHPDVHEIFFQVFDKGWMEDGQGTRIDFSNTVILLTSNVGSDVVTRLCVENPSADVEVLSQAIRPLLLQAFPAALLGRMTVIPYRSLSDETMSNIIRLQLDRVKERVIQSYGVPFTYDQSVVDHVRDRCNEVESGGRVIDSVITNTLLPRVSRELLERMLGGPSVERVSITASGGDFVYAFD